MLKTNASQILIQKGRELFDAPKQFIRFTNNKEADELLNNLSHFPHAFVLACVMNRQIRAEKAFMIPFAISEKLGSFEFTKLSNLSLPQVKGLMTKPEPLHRFVEVMGRNFYEGIKLISDKYDDNAANIWSNKPSSAELVYRFLEFHGIGPKIGTMAANILA
jgi:endonuclease III